MSDSGNGFPGRLNDNRSPTVGLVLILGVLAFLVFLILEGYQIRSWREAIPLRVTVTGTRGKSSVVRMIASILRQAGWSVLAKTTGSEACYILPDSRVGSIRRRGIPSIVEQKRLLKKARDLAVDCIVVEIMSLQPECHQVESGWILQAHKTLLTNLRPDHAEQMGEHPEQRARTLCLDFQPGTDIYLHPGEFSGQIRTDLLQKKCRPVICRAGLSHSLFPPENLPVHIIRSNLDLTVRFCHDLEIGNSAITRGVKNTRQDIGALSVWRLSPPTIYLVNAFSANDPQSTHQVFRRCYPRLAGKGRIIGLLNLRKDRPDRSRDWISFLTSPPRPWCDRLYVVGEHSRIFHRKIKYALPLRPGPPSRLLRQIELDDKGSILFGFGNIKGTGLEMIRYFQKQGEHHVI